MANPALEQPSEDRSGTVSQNAYEAPRIETVLTADEMVREVLYAGEISADGQVPG